VPLFILYLLLCVCVCFYSFLGDAPTLSQDFQNIEFDITPKRISSKNIWITKNKRIFEKKKIVSSFYQRKKF